MSELIQLLSNILPTTLDSFINITGLEWIAMLLSLAYVILAARGSLWCWPAAFISTALYTYIFYEFLLLMDSALNAYYLVMAIYGYWAWRKNKQDNTQKRQQQEFIVTSKQVAWHIKACVILAFISAGLGYFMDNKTLADFPYLDTFTTVYAVFATYLIAQRVLENWLYWVVIDLVSIYLYVEKALYPTVLLFIIFIGVAVYGYLKWRNLYLNTPDTINNNADSSFA